MGSRSNGSFLNGISADLHNMKECVMRNTILSYSLFTVLQDMQFLTTDVVLERIQQCAKKTDGEAKDRWGPHQYRGTINIYYTGHGEQGTGNWCFSNGTISLLQILKAVRSVNQDCDITLYADCCFSGNWCQDLEHCVDEYNNVFNGVYIYAACWPGQVAWDTNEGGMWTLQWCRHNKKNNKNMFKKLKRCAGYTDYKGKYGM